MNQVDWVGSETYILQAIEMYNWGGFQGWHKAEIDTAGTAVVGPTGSGKTTLVDALMTLLCASPRYNLASTGGHESDRDLVSYVRGVSGPGGSSAGQSHIARPGKTITGITATLQCGEKLVRLGALLWFEGTSSSAADMKKLWLFTSAPEQTLQHWLSVYHDGGLRALNQLEKEHTQLWSWSNKKKYLARIRDHFEVGENAFTLLNRAAGLKQLNSIDEIFRELVLDDNAAFDSAADVVSSFDGLTDIHQELETARRQQRALQPVASSWEKYQALKDEIQQHQQLVDLLAVWFARQSLHLWQAEADRLQRGLHDLEQEKNRLQEELTRQQTRVSDCEQRYHQAGGGSIEELRSRIADGNKARAMIAAEAGKYQTATSQFAFSSELSAAALQATQQQAAETLQQLTAERETAQEMLYNSGIVRRDLLQRLAQTEQEKTEIEQRPDSNLPIVYHNFRSDLASALNLDESALPFVAELVEVKAEDQAWRGAIERAIGSHRLRILVEPTHEPAALAWINQRHNRLHVRLLRASQPASHPTFLSDGYTHKLRWKDHPLREVAKALLADNDRHCVNSTDALRTTPHAMTREGLMSGKSGYFDKQDQKRLEDGWLTGFDNQDRLAFLHAEIDALQQQLSDAERDFRRDSQVVEQLQQRMQLLQGLAELTFDKIDLPGAERHLADLNQRLNDLTRPDSDAASARRELDQALKQRDALMASLRIADGDSGSLKTELKQANAQVSQAQSLASRVLSEEQQTLASGHFPTLDDEQRGQLPEIERQHREVLQQAGDKLLQRRQALSEELARRMSDAKREDTGALAEVGRELSDIPAYLQRLAELTEEALPEKLNRFLDYLARSSGEGVTQLLSQVEQEVLMIEERLEQLNRTMSVVDFRPGEYLRLETQKVVHDSLRTLQRAQQQLTASRFADDNGESEYKALQVLIALLKDACEKSRTLAAKALLDPRFRLAFKVSVIDRDSGEKLNTFTGSQGGSGGEKEIIASYVLTASLSYALCPSGSSHPLFGTIVLDEAFSRSSNAVAARIIAALRQFGLHAIFITPNKEMRLLRQHTRSAIVVHRIGQSSTLASLSWQALAGKHPGRRDDDEIPR